jgi:hypothetical protein
MLLLIVLILANYARLGRSQPKSRCHVERSETSLVISVLPSETNPRFFASLRMTTGVSGGPTVAWRSLTADLC